MALLWYLTYGAVDAFNHTKVGKGANGWEHALRVKAEPDFPMFTGFLSLIDANTFKALKYFFPEIHGKTSHVAMRQALARALIMNPLFDESKIPGQPFAQSDFALHTPEYKGVKCRMRCLMCSRLYDKKNTFTDLYCVKCDKYFCRDSASHGGRRCWSTHITQGCPDKRSSKKRAKHD